MSVLSSSCSVSSGVYPAVARSLVRESICSQYTAWDYHQMGLVATLELELDPATQDNTTAWQVGTETRLLVFGLEQTLGDV